MSRGRNAVRPREIPLKGLIDVGYRIFFRQMTANLGLIAAGIAFYGLLSLFPGITAVVAIAGIVVDRLELVKNYSEISAMLPDAAQAIVMSQAEAVASADETNLSFAAIAALLFAFYASTRATANFMAGLNIVYEEIEKRSIFKLYVMRFVLTGAMIFGVLMAVAIVAVAPIVAALFEGFPVGADAVMLARWPALFVLGVFGIAALYRYAPDRRNAKWRWVTPGAVLGCALWVAGSVGFSKYVQHFGSYNETFGALGGVIVLLTWLWVSAFAVLLGALLDAELEAQTARDSTVGPDLPMGQRGAVKADQLGKARGEQTV